MTKYYIARNYRSKFDAAGKAKMDCETILEENGWKNIGFKQTWISNAIVGTIVSAIGITWSIIRLKRKSTLCLQYPLNKFYNYILWAATLKKCHIITIVHDVYTLKGKLSRKHKELNSLKKSKSLIVHNSRMKEWFNEQKLSNNLIELDIFDYLHTKTVDIEKTPVNDKSYRIVFAGNMGGKQSFIYQLDELKRANYQFDLYGVKFNKDFIADENNTLLNYKGFFPSNEVIDHIDGDFGLVWYGNSLSSCEGKTGQYLKFNNPHKISLYIQCEIPVIIWKGAAMASFIEENKIGFSIDSLNDLPDILRKTSLSEFQDYKTNILKVKEKISKGYYLKTALDKALHKN